MKLSGYIVSIFLATTAILSCDVRDEHQSITSGQDVRLNISACYPDQGNVKVGLEGKSLKWEGNESATLVFGIDGTNNSSNPTIAATGEGVFSGTVTIPGKFSLDNLKGIIIPSENKGNFRGNHSTDKSRLRMYVPALQTQQKSGIFNPEYCPFFAPLTSDDLIPDAAGEYCVPALKLRSASDLIKFCVYGRHTAQRPDEVFKSISISIAETGKCISGTAEWNTITKPKALNSNGGATSTVSLAEEITLADKSSKNGVEVFLSVILGGTRTVSQITVTTDKATYSKAVNHKLPQKDVNRFTVFPININLSSGFTRTSTVYPADKAGWTEIKPEDAGFDAGMKEKLDTYLSTTDLTCMSVIAGGEQIYRYGDDTQISYIASCRKSVLAMLYGKYVENGTVDLTTTVGELLEAGIPDDVGGLLEIEKQATLFDIITSRSGVYHDASNGGDTEDKPVRGSKIPGEYYVYNNWDFNFAGTALEFLVKGSFSNKEIYQIMEEDIAIPTGMADWSKDKCRYGGTWKGDSALSYYPAYHIYISTRDMARIGYLMLRGGRWKDTQVIPETWMAAMLTPYSTFAEVNPGGSGYFSYGYMWWLFDESYYASRPAYEGAYMARGSGGQYILIMPALDMVTAWKTDTSGGKSTSFTQFRKAVTIVLDSYDETI